MLVTRELEMELNGKKIKRYSDLGYNIPKYKDKDSLWRVRKGTSIKVKIEDIPDGSHVFVEVKCDYCETIFKVRYDAYNRQLKKSTIEKDACDGCKNLKTLETNNELYGVDNVFQLDEVKRKSKETMMSIYGVEHPSQSEVIKNRTRNTLYKNQSAPTSSQQILINEVIGGELNYSDDSTGNYNLDMAFVEEKIYFEYDGSGHDLQVKFGNKTQKEFDRDEIKRSYYLRRRDWKESRLISRKDKIPTNEALIDMKNKIFEELILNDCSFIIFDIDKNTIRTKKYEKNWM